MFSELQWGHFTLGKSISSTALQNQGRILLLEDLKKVIQTGIHHCNNQLAGILSNSDLITLMNSPEVTEKKIENIKLRVSVIADALYALHCFSQMDAVINKEDFLINDFCQKLINDYSAQLNKQYIKTLIEINPHLQVHTCTNILTKIFKILIQNSIDALTGDNRLIKINVDIEGDKTYLKFQDSGPALPPEVLEKLFNPFFSTKAGKIGQGLTEVRTLIRLLGGELQFSRQDDYNCIDITIQKSEAFDAQYV